ncbi:AMP-binding protein, partial [Amycolatopsis sp. NPDC000673]
MSKLPDFVRTLTDNAQARPDHVAITTVRWTGNEMTDECRTYRELDREARSLAVWLSQRHRPGERALLLYPSGLEQVRAQLACLYAGLLPVTAPVPRGRKHHLTPATALAFDAEVSVVLTDSAVVSVVSDWMGQDGLSDVPVAITDTIAADPAEWTPPARPPDAPVLLQYVAGSAIDPKGVLVSNANLVSNMDRTRRAFNLSPHDRSCGWLPQRQTHRIIGVLLAPLWLGASTVLMDRDDFLDHPHRLLRVMDRYRATVTIAHSHAYDLCVRDLVPERLRGLDLTRWRCAVTIGEDITPSTLRAFADKLAEAGLPTGAARTAYLRPEATFLVCSSGLRVAKHDVT